MDLQIQHIRKYFLDLYTFLNILVTKSSFLEFVMKQQQIGCNLWHRDILFDSMKQKQIGYNLWHRYVYFDSMKQQQIGYNL